jgi:hypothetical protein
MIRKCLAWSVIRIPNTSRVCKQIYGFEPAKKNVGAEEVAEPEQQLGFFYLKNHLL